MRVFDAHCDMLYKLWRDPSIDVYEDPSLHVSISKLKAMNKPIQCFAIFVPNDVPFVNRLAVAHAQINLFYQKVLKKYPEVKLIKTKSDLLNLAKNEIGAILTLEGCDAIGDQLEHLEILYQLGVRSVGLTWNFANLVADGAHEKRNGGLTNFGREVVHYLNDQRLWTDLSHASERSFWEALDLAEYPIASHSNAHKLCAHVRNLKDEQIVALFKKKGIIGVTFVPFFTTNSQGPKMSDVLKHVDYLCALGGENNIGFGSDFDGIDETIPGLNEYSCYYDFVNQLLNYYPQRVVKKFVYQNFIDHLSY
ncbi:dipeptidase [Metabacillus rhizolycopersici]|uniref:Dipeptidase n=1 Tax=Metabacillus rhizolycopersici TaxID=2875709 RepID=A0ABS7UQR9_9BACI|nr:dipeptidase [Metabacillus rhizolycopersici]MBZ5750506.1 dipeptidase [Metabacillus rhizolycopersici]